MRILGYEIRKMRAYGPLWWLLFLGMLALAFMGCRDATAPTMAPTEAQVLGSLKANGFNPTAGTGATCQPIKGGTQAQVALCFTELWRALAIGGAAFKTCSLAVGAASTAVGAYVAGSVCSLGFFSTYEGFDTYLAHTQVREWANQSAEEIANRMRQAIYERMVARGEWRENAGCC